jgi:hypothetical protein
MSWRCSGFVKSLLKGINGEPLTRSEKLIALVLADYYDESYGFAWPSISRLARESLMSGRMVRRVLRSLEEKGILQTRKGGGVGCTSRYRFPGLVDSENTAMVSVLNTTTGGKAINGKGTPAVRKGTPGVGKGDIAMSAKPSVVQPPVEPPSSRYASPENRPPWPIHSPRTFWKAVLKAAKNGNSKVRWQIFEEHLVPARAIGWQDGRLILKVPTEEFAAWLHEREGVLLGWIHLAGVEDITGISYVVGGSQP